MVNRTGVGYYTAQLVEALAAEYPEVELVGYYYNFLGRKSRPVHPIATNIRYRPVYHFPGPIINLLRRFRIEVPIELLTFVRADFILYSNYLGQPSLFHTPYAPVIHDLTFVDMPQYVSRRNLRDLRRFIPKQIRRSNFLVTVSEFSKRRIVEEFHVGPSDILVTPIPPEIPAAASSARERHELAKLGVTGPYVLTLGTVEPRKNLLNMLNAYLQLSEELQKKYIFVVAGKIGWNCEAEIARLQQLRGEGKNIIHLGYVTDLQRTALYRNATLFTSASYYEGFGMPALEAMSYGTPVAISDIEVFREVAGHAALYFDQQNPESISAAWQKLLTDEPLRRQLAAKGKAHVEKYSWGEVAASLYQKIIDTLEGEKS